MTDIDLLLEPRWVVPIAPRGRVLENYSVAVRAGQIIDILPAAEARAAYVPLRTEVLAEHALTPGLVNAHTHAAMTLLRGVGDDLPLMRWLRERIWPLESALVSPEFVYDGTRLAAMEMLRAGTTCCSDMYFFPDAAIRAMRGAGMRAVAGIIAIEFPTAYANDADDYLRRGLAARDAMRDDALTTFTLAPHAPYTVADATLERIAVLAEELDLPIHMHAHETVDEIAESLAQHGLRPLARLDRLKLVTERLIAVHAVHLDAIEIELLAARGASVAHCPSSNLKLGSGMAPVAALSAAGVNLAIGTDGAASNNRLDLLGETRLAALLAKGVTGDATALPAALALEAATLGGARALALDRRIGSIEIGKEADLTAFDLSSIETLPNFDVVSQLVYAAGREHVTDVWVHGEHVVRKRQVAAALDQSLEDSAGARVAAWQNRCRHVLQTVGIA